MTELTADQEVQFGEELDAIHDRITTIDALTSFLVGLKLDGSQRPRVARIVKATAHARSYLPDTGRKLSTYDSERATAFATVAIAEACALVLERALAARRA